MKKQIGFTLIELMIVVAIIGILIAIFFDEGSFERVKYKVEHDGEVYITQNYYIDDGCIEMYDLNKTVCGSFTKEEYRNAFE